MEKKKRMENKMQDSNSLREKIENTINVIQFEKGRDLTVAESITTGGMDRIMQIVASEISKAREEGRKNTLEEIKESMESYLEDDTTTYEMVEMLLTKLKTKEDEK